MQYRKEPILFVIALALAAWVVLDEADDLPNAVVRAESEEFTSSEQVDTILVPPTLRPPVATRDAFVEPSEAVPLPPRQLTLPPLARLPLVRPPAPGAGQGVRAWHQLRVAAPPEPETPFDFSISGDAQPAADANPASSTDVDPNAQIKRARFDRVVTQNSTFWGELKLAGEEKFRLVERGLPYPPVTFDWMDEKGDLINTLTFDPSQPRAEKVLEIELANTLENEVGLRRVRIPDGVDSVQQRQEFVLWLLERARTEPSVFKEARAQAEKIVEYTNGQEDGYVWLVRVLRAEGRLEDEWQLYSTHSNGSTPAWVLRGRGEVQSTLTLYEAARDNLEAAVRANPDNPRNHAALSRFLLRQGDLAGATEEAAIAFRQRTYVPRIDRPAIIEQHLNCLIASGNTAGARAAVPALNTAGATESDVSMYRGLAAYAAGEMLPAEAAFTASSEPEAQVGRALCAFRPDAEDRWGIAHGLLKQASDSAPLLRGHSSAALAILYEFGGAPDQALAAATMAGTADPVDPYVQYVLCRELRLSGQYDQAIERAEEALRTHDAATEIVAELAMSLLLRFRSQGDATDLGRAFRYADRVVDLDRDSEGNVRTTLFLELRGLLAYRNGDFAGARRSFEEADRRGSFFGRLGIAVIDYGQRRTDAARDALLSLSGDFDLPQERRDQAKRLLAEIDDHAEKEIVRDDFERERIGRRWQTQERGDGRVRLVDGRVEVSGQSREDVFAARSTPQAGAFVRTSATMEIGPGDRAEFAGLRIARESSRGTTFFARLGVKESTSAGRVPVLEYSNPDKSGTEEEVVTVRLDGAGLANFDLFGKHTLAFEIVGGEPGERVSTFGLRALWNGRVVAEVEDLGGQMRPQIKDPLVVQFFLEGKNRPLQAFFDDFRLVRRRTD